MSAKDFHVRVFGENSGRARALDGGVDVNGRFDLEAHDIAVRYDAAGAGRHHHRQPLRRGRAPARRRALPPGGGRRSARVVRVSGGARVDRVTTKNTGGFFGDRSENNAAFSGFASVTAGSFGGFSATAQVARGFRDPTLSDRYFRGPTGRGFITGNPGLEPETSLQFDLALRYAAARWRVAVYGTTTGSTTSSSATRPTPTSSSSGTAASAEIQGAEAELQADLPWRLGLELTAHQLSGRPSTTTRRSTRSPCRP